MEIKRNHMNHGYEYVIRQYDLDGVYEYNMFSIYLTVKRTEYILHITYSMPEDRIVTVEIFNQYELSEEDKEKGYMYAEMLEKEFVIHMKYIINNI